MSQPGAVSRISLSIVWLLLGLAMIAVPVWLGWTRWPAILSGHPAMLVAGIVCGLLGFVAVAWSVATLGSATGWIGRATRIAPPAGRPNRCNAEPAGGSSRPFRR